MAIEQVRSTRVRPEWASSEHPVYALEVRRRVENRSMVVLRQGCATGIFASAGLLLTGILGTVYISQASFGSIGWQDYQYTVPIVLGWGLAILLMIQIGAGALINIMTIAQVAPLISGEVELQSWGLLRTTTLTLREIVFAKYAAALNQLRGPLFALVILHAATAGTALILYTHGLLRSTLYYMSSLDIQRAVIVGQWLPPTIAVIATVAAYVAQPVIQVLLNASLGLVTSTFSRTRGQAIAAGLISRLALWVLIILLNFAAIFWISFFRDQWSYPEYSIFESFQGIPAPSPLQVAWMDGMTVAGYAVAFLAAQAGLTILLLGLALRRTRHLGA